MCGALAGPLNDHARNSSTAALWPNVYETRLATTGDGVDRNSIDAGATGFRTNLTERCSASPIRDTARAP